MSDTDLAQRVCDLEERVAYLERELELSVEEQRFERQIKRICPRGNDYEINVDGMGYYTATMSLNPGDLPHTSAKISDTDNFGWQVEESTEDSVTILVKQGLINQ